MLEAPAEALALSTTIPLVPLGSSMGPLRISEVGPLVMSKDRMQPLVSPLVHCAPTDTKRMSVPPPMLGSAASPLRKDEVPQTWKNRSALQGTLRQPLLMVLRQRTTDQGQGTTPALRVLPVMRARRLRGLHLAAGQGAHLEDALEARRWLAIRLPRRARLPCRRAGASTGDGGRPARFIWCIHDCDLTLKLDCVSSRVGFQARPESHLRERERRVSFRTDSALCACVG